MAKKQNNVSSLLSLGTDFFGLSFLNNYNRFRKEKWLEENTKVVDKPHTVSTGGGGLTVVQVPHRVDKNTGKDLGAIGSIDYSKIKFNTGDASENFLNQLPFLGFGLGRAAVTGGLGLLGNAAKQWLPKLSFELGLGAAFELGLGAAYRAIGTNIGLGLDAALLGVGAYHGLTDMYNNGINVSNTLETGLSFLPAASNIFNRFAIPKLLNPKFKALINNIGKPGKVTLVYHITPEDSGLVDLSKANAASSRNIGVSTITDSSKIEELAENLGFPDYRVVTGFTHVPNSPTLIADFGENGAGLINRAAVVGEDITPITNASDTFKTTKLTELGVGFTNTGSKLVWQNPRLVISPLLMHFPNATPEIKLASKNVAREMPTDYFVRLASAAMLPLNLKVAAVLHRNGKFPFRINNAVEGVDELVVHPDDVYTTGFDVSEVPESKELGVIKNTSNLLLDGLSSNLKTYPSEPRSRGEDAMRSHPLIDIFRLQWPTSKTGPIGYGNKYRSIGGWKGLKSAIDKDAIISKNDAYNRYNLVYWSLDYPLREYTTSSPLMLVYDKGGDYKFGIGNFGNPISRVSDPIRLSDDNISLFGRYPFTSKYFPIPKTEEGFLKAKKLSNIHKYIETPIRKLFWPILSWYAYDKLFL